MSEERKSRKTFNELPAAKVKMNSTNKAAHMYGSRDNSIVSRRSTEFHDAMLDKDAIREADRDYARYRVEKELARLEQDQLNTQREMPDDNGENEVSSPLKKGYF